MNQALSRSSSRRLLANLLEEPQLVAIVQGLPPQVLGRLIRHVGLEDAGELVALATTAQLERVFDDDLWRASAPGQDDEFDAERFSRWLEIMLEAGTTFATRRLLALDEDLVMLAMSKQLGAVDADRVAAELWHGGAMYRDDALRNALDSQQYHEFEQYMVYSMHEPSWSAWLSILLELDRDHHAQLNDWLERLAELSQGRSEFDAGFYDAFSAAETLNADISAARDDRRELEGYVTASDARSFLTSARTSSLVELLAARKPDPITQAYFGQSSSRAPEQRGARPATERAAVDQAASPQRGEPSLHAAAPASPAASQGWVQALRDAELLDSPQPTLLTSGGPAPSHTMLPVSAALQRLAHDHPQRYDRHVIELSYVANVLLAGATHAGRALRPVESAQAALALCNLGLERALGPNAVASPAHGEHATAWLLRHDLVTALRVGLHVVHHDLVHVACRALRVRLQRAARVRSGASGRHLGELASALAAAAACDRPWRAAAQLDALASTLRPDTLAAFRVLLDECPSMPPHVVRARGRGEPVDGGFVARMGDVRLLGAILQRFERGGRRGPTHTATSTRSRHGRVSIP